MLPTARWRASCSACGATTTSCPSRRRPPRRPGHRASTRRGPARLRPSASRPPSDAESPSSFSPCGSPVFSGAWRGETRRKRCRGGISMVPKGDIVRRGRRCQIAISDVLKHAITQAGSHDCLQLPGNWLGYVSIPNIDWWAEVPEYCCRERSICPLAFRHALFARDARNALRAHATASIKLVNDYKSYQRV